MTNRLEDSPPSLPPILDRKAYAAPSVFTAENLLREARRQKRLADSPVPAVCVLDPDGDLIDYLRATGRAERHAGWACYHTELFVSEEGGASFGIIGRVVGASFAVLVAEELFACGCWLLISITSAGQIASLGTPPYAVLLTHALRDEGTSYHYLPPARYSLLRPALRAALEAGWQRQEVMVYSGASWTTDAPFRETAASIAACRDEGIVAVEMEAAALYALAEAKHYAIVCFAHVTNQMAQGGDDFEKGADGGSHTALAIIQQTIHVWQDDGPASVAARARR